MVSQMIRQTVGSRGYYLVLLGLTLISYNRAHAKPPIVLDPNWQLEQIEHQPEIVTPTGCCIDDRGRMFVIECNTHFAPEGYERADHDRIYLYEDTNNGGEYDSRTIFYDDGVATMNVAYMGEGWLAVATRSQVVKMRDSDADNIADQFEVLLTLKTEATYPHNGLGGLAYNQDGWLYVGQGENFGEPYTLIAKDASQQVGGGEGGNIFRVRADGSNLQRIATGFWNPFGICVDSEKRIWTVGNDPDAMPPCRLLHVVEGGDYGFQFRFGRAGIHPLQAWNGELPGTLPMAAGTGEATCAVLQHENALWVTSWGDNRIERYSLTSDGASLNGHMEIVVQGDAMFRPVGIAATDDGSLYFTDWVDRSYPVHGKGGIWKLKKTSQAKNNERIYPPLSEDEKLAARLSNDSTLKLNTRVLELSSTDPFIRQAAVTGLLNSGQIGTLDWDDLADPQQKVGFLLAYRWGEMTGRTSLDKEVQRQLIETALKDNSELVVLTAVRWATESVDQQHLTTIRNLLSRTDLTPRLFNAVIASIAFLETGSAAGGRRDPVIEKALIEVARDAAKPANLRALAIRKLQPNVEEPTAAELRAFLNDQKERTLALEIVRLLAARGGADSEATLEEIAADETLDNESRADALTALAGNAGSHAKLINKLSLPRQPEVLRTEAKRIIDFGSARSGQPKPAPDDLVGWEALVGNGGNVERGRRVFARKACSNCHSHAGRGATTGPDLTTFAMTTTTQRLLESILLPNKEVGPLYVPYRILTVNGNVLTGLKLDGSGAGKAMTFQGADGDKFSVDMEDIEQMEPTDQSIMPSGLQESMSVEELRDLIAFLNSSSSSN